VVHIIRHLAIKGQGGSFETLSRILQPPSEKQYDEDDEHDSADPDSAIGSVGVITTAATKQQK